MKNKKGFTLIEIIVCIVLITLISTISIIIINNKKQQSLLEKYSSKFENALQVYLSNHEEIAYNLENNAKAAAVTLEVLKNEGLIDKNIKGLNYKKNYFLLSNAKLLNEESVDKTNCDNDVVGVEVFAKWDLEKDDIGNKVIYICPQNNSSDNQNILNNYVAVGNDPDNYIKIEDKIWRILESTNNGIYVITTNEEDLIDYNTNKEIDKINIDSLYYSKYADKFTLVMETNADTGHRGLDAIPYTTLESNVGSLNYTSIMNVTTASGNWIINLYSGFHKLVYIANAFTYNPNDPWNTFDVINDSDDLDGSQIVPFIKLKECYKIIKGSGTKDNPYELGNNCS